MRRQIRLLVILFTLAFSIFNPTYKIMFQTASATYVEQPITQDTVWTLVDSPFVVSKDILVYPDATLTIEPGVEVRFGGEFSLTISGILFANGTSNPIKFTSNKMQPAAGDWNSIVFNGIEKSTLIGCLVDYGKDAIYIENGNLEIKNSTASFSENGVTAKNGNVTLQDSTIKGCSKNGIVANSSQVTAQNNLVMENYENGFCVTGNGQVTIQWNEIIGNGNGILLAGNDTSGVNISYNKISANIANGIEIDATNNYDITISYNNVSSNDKGLYISSLASTTIMNNSISYNIIGVLYGRGNHFANYNDIYGNEMGMDVESSATVNAEHNYWGDKSGPYHEILNPAGRGNEAGGDGINLDFIFFLTKSIGIINIRPTANLLTDKILVLPNENVMFFATESSDNDGRVDRYFFDFGDGSNSSWVTLSVFAHKYALNGTYHANVTIMDDYGATNSSVDVTVSVQNLTPLQVNVNMSSSIIHEGETVSITTYVTNGTIAIENAIVTMFSVKGGNFSTISGLTNATGCFATMFTAPDIVEKAYIRIVARASLNGYTDAAAHKYIEVSPFLSVELNADPSTVKSEGSSQIIIHVTSNSEPIVNASLAISSTSGSLSSETGVTDPSGSFSVIFTAPQTTSTLSVNVTVEATKDDYIDGTGQTVITIQPKILSVQIAATPNITISESGVNVTVHVEYNMISIAGANVTVDAENGNFSINSDLTDTYGNVEFIFTTPPVNVQSNITITVSASKAGYAPAQSQVEITVNPRTFSVQISPSVGIVQSGTSTAIIVHIRCNEDNTTVAGANVTLSSSAGDFTFASETTDSTGTSIFMFNAPQTLTQISVNLTAVATKNGYVDGGNQTSVVVVPTNVGEAQGGWSIITILLIIVPIVIAVIVVVLIKLKVITISSKEEESE